jgi:peptidoglycan/xylan/chitin deacetylase (PgdA/CDA1 family)
VTLPPEHLQYPRRRRGMDHDRYDWSPLPRRPPVAWPGGARLALWVLPVLEWFPLDMAGGPVRPAGAVDEPYPDFRSYTHRDYGHRVGVFRLMAALDRFGLRATAPVNAAVCDRYPLVIEEGLRRGWEFVAHGLHMGRPHHAGLSEADEAAMVDEALATVRRATGQAVRGWLSPANAESARTLDLLAARGIAYVCDWVNDELPYRLRTGAGDLHALPYAHELADTTVMWERHHTPAEWAEQLRAAFDCLYAEAGRAGGRALGLAVHPWCAGQPHRIRALEAVLAHATAHAGVWAATGGEVLAAWRAQASQE